MPIITHLAQDDKEKRLLQNPVSAECMLTHPKIHKNRSARSGLGHFSFLNFFMQYFSMF